MTPWGVISRVASVVRELKCTNCGAQLEILNRWSAECAYCQARFLVVGMDEIIVDEKWYAEPDPFPEDEPYFVSFPDDDYFFRGGREW